MSTGQLVLGVILLWFVLLVTAPLMIAGLSLVYRGLVLFELGLTLFVPGVGWALTSS